MRSTDKEETRAMAIDYATKTGILAALTDIFQGVDYPIQLELSKDGNQVIIHYDNGMPDDRANIRGDNHMAMLYDLFKQCGPHMMAKI